MLLYAAIFIVALASTLLLTPVVKTFALKIGALDSPAQRKIHISPVPRLGGLAIYLGFMLASILGLGLAVTLGMKINLLSFSAIIAGATVLLAVGIIDDLKGLSALQKLIIQILAASLAIWGGVQITFISNPFNGLFFLGILSIPATLFWIVGITNTINLIDGLDGLAAGITAIAAFTLFVVALRTHQIGAAILLSALAGAALGFLKFNFNPASIFLGDSGSLFLGFILATISIIGVLKSTIFIALVIPILILGIPIFDTTSAIIRRVKAKRPIFTADLGHIHHHLIKEGFTQRQAVLSIYFICTFLSLGALLVAAINDVQALFVFPIVILFGIISLTWIKTKIKNNAPS